MSGVSIGIVSIRGAITVEEDNREFIQSNTLELINEIISENSLNPDCSDFVNCIISTTQDITSYYPAAAITQSGIMRGVPLFSTLEPKIDGQLPLTIRVMLTVNLCGSAANIKHVYLKGAKNLNTNA